MSSSGCGSVRFLILSIFGSRVRVASQKAGVKVPSVSVKLNLSGETECPLGTPIDPSKPHDFTDVGVASECDEPFSMSSASVTVYKSAKGTSYSL
jgi:hypothetical protein